ncbi:phe13-bombesin receptor-like [Ptychodera flava]|uniref:phe13-bombesin receptor-like n=1 Tax=Ptychodera flava TaxID=63121 RepID=UPI00396A8E0C
MTGNSSLNMEPLHMIATYSPDSFTAYDFVLSTIIDVTNSSRLYSWNDSMPNDTFFYQPRPGPEAVIIPAAFALIFIIGVVGNGTLVRIVLMNPNMRSVPNIFIASLAIGDLLLLLVFVPFNALTYITTSWPLGEAMCKLMNGVQVASTGVSVFTLTALSADRYHAIVNPINKKASNMMRTTYTISIGIWLISLSLGIPTFVLASLVEYTFGNTTVVYFCQAIPMTMPILIQAHTAAMFVILYLIPLGIISVYYILIAIKLIQSSKGIPGENCRNDTKQLRARKRLAKLILVFVLIFLICWLPYHAFNMMLFFSKDTSHMESYSIMFFKSFGNILAYSNSCVNPLALYFLSNTFKAYYNRYILCCCYRKSKKHEFNRRYYKHASLRCSHSNTMSRTTQRSMVYSV